MGTIKISIELGVNSAAEIRETIANIFTPANDSKPAPANDPKPADPAPANDPKPADPAPANGPKPADPAPANDPKPADPAPVSDIKLEDLQDMVRACVNGKGNREKIKEHLTELGAKSLSTLDKSKYEEMYEFLNTLK